jgi:hypothetical protein
MKSHPEPNYFDLIRIKVGAWRYLVGFTSSIFLNMFAAPTAVQAEEAGTFIPIGNPPVAETTVIPESRLNLDGRLAPGLQITSAEKVIIERAKADLSERAQFELAEVRENLSVSFAKAAELAENANALRVAILYAASASDLNPGEHTYRAHLGTLYNRYATFEIVAGFAAQENFSAASRLKSLKEQDTVAPETPAAIWLRDHKHRMRTDHLARTYQGRHLDHYLGRLGEGMPAKQSLVLDERTQSLLAKELEGLAKWKKDLEERRSRWQERLSDLEQANETASPAATDKVRTQLTQVEIEIEANGLIVHQIKSWRDEVVEDNESQPDNELEVVNEKLAPRSALAVAREILSLQVSPAPHPVYEEKSGASLSVEVTQLLSIADKAGARGWTEHEMAKAIAERGLLVRLSRIAAQSRDDRNGDRPASKETPPAPEIRVAYGPRRSTRPQVDNDNRFARSGVVREIVPIGAILSLEADVEIPEADPQPWIGYAWILYDMNQNNRDTVAPGKSIIFNDEGAAQLGAHSSNQPANFTLRHNLPTVSLAPGPYDVVLAAFYLADDGSFDTKKAAATTVLTRTSFELAHEKIAVHLDMADQIASPGWGPLNIVTSDWIKPPYTVEIELQDLIFRGTDETALSAKGLSPLLNLGGVMTPPKAPAKGEGSISVRVTDDLGRIASATHAVIIGGAPQTMLAPSLSKAVKHPE